MTLRDLLAEGRFVRLVGAHDGLSAMLVQQLNFEGIWAGGLGISTAHGLPDAGLLTMTEVLHAATVMRRASTLPIVVDVDSGFGDAAIVRRMVRLYEDAGLDGICLEDKEYPKRNSFCDGNRLAPAEDVARKIEAAKASQRGTEMMVFARHESLIAGAGMDDALARAALYRDAGADVVLIHSRQPTAHEVGTFCRRWAAAGGDLPVCAIPTTYHQADVDELASLGVSIAIYANHLVRATLRAMQVVLDSLAKDGSTARIEGEIASLASLFATVGMDEPVAVGQVTP